MPRGRQSAGGGNEKETRGIRRAERGKKRDRTGMRKGEGRLAWGEAAKRRG